MADRLILLVGASGSGKTTIAKELEQLGYNIIHSFTTRKEREEGEWGHTFIPQLIDRHITCISISGGVFGSRMAITIDAKKEEENPLNGQVELLPYIYYCNSVVAHRKIYDDHYWATESQYKDKGTSIYVVCPDGAKQVQENVKDAEVITIFLMADEVVRYRRMLQTRLASDSANRIENDRAIFKTCKCDYVVDANRGLDEVFEDLIEIIGA